MYKVFLTFLLSISIISSASATESFTFIGKGFGHGVGLSQFGAKSMAISGSSAEDILKYYFTGVAVEPVADWYDIRVNIGHEIKKATLQLSSNAGFIKINGYLIDNKETIATFNQTSIGISTTIRKSKMVVTVLPPSNSILIQWSGTRFLEGPASVIKLNAGKSMKYQFGEINLQVVGSSFEITNNVRLKDEYLYGISEVSSSWPKESLRAQVIAARTYAMAKAGIYRPTCDCELFGSIQDQMFVGISKISEAKYGPLWKNAVDSTNIDEDNGLAITFMGNPISAYYSSSTGGMTESALNAFGIEVEYLKPVVDLASVDPKFNPNYASWTRIIPEVIVAKAFGLPNVQKLEIKEKHIEATSSNGNKVSLRLETFRSRALLPSPFFKLNLN